MLTSRISLHGRHHALASFTHGRLASSQCPVVAHFLQMRGLRSPVPRYEVSASSAPEWVMSLLRGPDERTALRTTPRHDGAPPPDLPGQVAYTIHRCALNGADARALQQLCRQLPEPAARTLLRLLWTVDGHAEDRLTQQQVAHWEAVLGHFPGLAPALRLVSEHVQPQVRTPDCGWEGCSTRQPRMDTAPRACLASHPSFSGPA